MDCAEQDARDGSSGWKSLLIKTSFLLTFVRLSHVTLVELNVGSDCDQYRMEFGFARSQEGVCRLFAAGLTTEAVLLTAYLPVHGNKNRPLRTGQGQLKSPVPRGLENFRLFRRASC